MTRAPTSTGRRAIAAIAIGAGGFGLALVFRLVLGQKTSDFDQIVVGARLLLAGASPYTRTPLPGLDWPIYYPAPALVLGIPFAPFSLPWGQALFCGLSGACFGWAMSEDGDAKLFGVATWPFILTMSLGQWSPLLMATATLPALGWVNIAKPNIGLALFMGYASRWIRGRALVINIIMCAGLILSSFVLRPVWPKEWMAVLKTPTPHLLTPFFVWGGPLLLLALLRWRRAEARFLATLACVPQTFSSYDSLLVFLIPKTRREALVLVAATTVATAVIGFVGPAATYAATVHKFAPMRIVLVYLPALAIILRRANQSV